VTQPAQWFRTTVAYGLYRHPDWAPELLALCGFDLARERLCVGAVLTLMPDIYGDSFEERDSGRPPSDPRLSAPPTEIATVLPLASATRGCEFRYAERDWVIGEASGDIGFAATGLAAARDIWASAVK